MNEQNIIGMNTIHTELNTTSFLSADDGELSLVSARLQLYLLKVSAGERYVLDKICEQKDYYHTQQLTKSERIIVNSVFVAFCFVKLRDIFMEQDRDRLEETLPKLLEIPEISVSKKLKRDISITQANLKRKDRDEFCFFEDAAGLLYDWIMITKYFYSKEA